ncbi:MAG TPA: ABC transporter ATP-binding protein [Planctomycetota bacterium]|nr:ABC transporter ATP-binding protein [Planctomycetota bacterium]
MRNYFRYLAYIWHYKVRVITSIVTSLLAEVLSLASMAAYLAAHDVLLSLWFSNGQDAGSMAKQILKLPKGKEVIEYLRTRATDKTTLMWTVIALGFAFFLTGILRGVFVFLRRYLLESAAQRGWMDLLNHLFLRVSGLSVRFFSHRSLGHTMSTFGPDLGELGAGGRMIFSHAVRDTFSLLLGVIAMFLVSARLALMVIVGVPVALLVFKIVGTRIRRYTAKGLEKRADAMKILAETVQGITVIKAYDAEGYQRDRFLQTSRRMLRYDLRRALTKAMSDPSTEILLRACLWAVGAYGVYLYVQFNYPWSMLVTFSYAVKKVYEPLDGLRDLNNEIQASRAAADRVFAVMDLEPEVVEKPDARPLPPHSSEIRFDHVSFAYEPPEEVVRDFDLTIRAGEVVAIVGENGSGKSTLVSLLLRFYDPTRGAIRVDGSDLRDVTQSSLRRQIGYVSQNVLLFNDTVRRNIAFGNPRYTDEEIEAAARVALAHEFIMHDLSAGYGTMVGEGGAKLSGGQRQRLSLARALLRDPRILILDEATSAMDAEAEHRFEGQLAGFAKGRTVILIAHRFSALRAADRIVVLDRGRIEAVGTHEQVLAASPIYRNLYHKQSLAREAT